jgi:dTDP-4-dehydrorhamnose 3,5-epimerase
VVVDIRRGSPTWLKWIAVELSAENFRQIYVPGGYAHGICVTSDAAELEYQCTDFYDADDELRIIWNDPSIGVRWPAREPILSDKDRGAATLAEQMEQLPVWRGQAMKK